jgi:hypothetical protein
VVCDVWATGRRCTVVDLQPPLSTRLADAWCLLVVRRLRRCAHSPKRDHGGHAQGISVTLIVHRPLGLQGTRGGPGPAPGRAAGAGAAEHMVAPDLSRAGQRELVPQDTWRPRSCPGPGNESWGRRTRARPQSCPGPGSGSWDHRTRCGPGAAPGRAMRAGAARHGRGPRAAPGRAAGAGAAGHAAAPELPRAGQLVLRLTTRRDV